MSGYFMMAWDKDLDVNYSFSWAGGEENYINKRVLPEMCRTVFREVLKKEGYINY